MIDDITDSCIISLQYRLSCFLLDCYFEQKRLLMLLTFLWFITGIGFDVCFQVTTVSKFFSDNYIWHPHGVSCVSFLTEVVRIPTDAIDSYAVSRTSSLCVCANN